jgi:hypothetical protein
MKPLVTSKLFWSNVVLALVAVGQLLLDSPVVPPEALPFVALAIGVLNIILRVWFTDTTIRGMFKSH